MRGLGLFSCVLVAGCGGASVGFPDGSTDGGGIDATLDAGADGAGGDSGVDADAMPCPLRCSPDTLQVLDCNDKVVQTCQPTEACDIAQSKCVNACAAQANNRQSIGCEFHPAYLEVYPVNLKCHAVVVANTWKAPAKIQVDYNGMQLPVASFARIPIGSGPTITYGAYDPMMGIKPGEVAILFLGGNSSPPGCPAPPATSGTTAQLLGTTIGKSFHLVTDVPVAVYQIQPYGGGSAAATGSSLLLPVTAWGTNYVVNTASPMTPMVSPPAFAIVAHENTTVKLLPKVAVNGSGGIPSGNAGQTMSFSLAAGEVAQIAQQADLAGSILETSKPVGVWSSSACMNVPMGTGYCDHGEQMLLPIQALGSEYAAVAHRPRTMEPWLWRLVGVVDGTNLAYSPAVAGAPATIAKGQIAEFESTTPFVVSSQDAQHPFQLLAYMSGGAWPKLGNTPGYGDPDHVVVTPPGQFLRSYVFFSDPTFPETNVVVVRAKNGNVFEDVTLDCAGKLGGWQALGSAYEYTRVDLQTGNFLKVGGCDNGRHEASSAGPFGLWVWGWGTPNTQMFTSYVSYGYPGGTNVRAVNNVVVPAQ